MDSQKVILRSLLTATPMALTVSGLAREYRSTVGEPIPYSKLGYHSLEHFLCSIPDTLRIEGSGPCAIVNPVVSEKSVHVMQLVSKQKVERKRSSMHQMKRMVVSQPPDRSRKYPTPTTSSTKPKIFYPAPTKAPFPSENTNSKSTTRPSENPVTSFSKPPERYLNNTSKPVINIKIPPLIQNVKNTNSETKAFGEITKSFEDMNITPSPIVGPNIQKLNMSHRPSSSRNSTKPEDSHSPCGSRMYNILTPKTKLQSKVDAVDPFPVDDSEERIPYAVRNNLKVLIDHYPDGIWCADVPDVYRKMFKREIKHHDLGFRNLIDLCICLKSIFHYVRPGTEDFKLYDRSKPLPASVDKTYTAASFSPNGNSGTDNGNISALPKIEWSDVMAFLPPGVFKPGQEIPRTFVPNTTKQNDTIDIRVGEVFDVSKFWVFRDDKLLDNLMDEMQLFYAECASEYKFPQNLVREGVYCAAVIYGEYHRALIVDTMYMEDEIKVFFIDYGTMAKIKCELFFLHEKFAQLPAQTIRCRLADICPKEKAAPWSQECTKEFRQLIKDRDLTAKISYINWKDQFLEIFLADVTDPSNVFYINYILIEKGYAVLPGQEQENSLIDSLSTPIVSLIHLFPTFLELEHGLAPSTFEMEIYHQCNIPINFCYPQYFFNDHTAEEATIKQVTEFYERSLKGSRRHSHATFDISKCSDKIDFSHFGDLEKEMRAYFKNNQHFCETNKIASQEEVGEASNAEETDISSISKKIEMWKRQTVSELKNDRLLSEDIMNDLFNICNVSKADSEPSEDCVDRNVSSQEVSSSSLPFKTLEDAEMQTTYSQEENDVGNHPLLDLSFSRSLSSDSLNTPTYQLKGTDVADHLSKECNEMSEDELHDIGEACDLERRMLNPNNPFLNSLDLDSEQFDSDIVTNNGRLIPTNPFLTYVPDRKDDNSDNTDSTTSTDYGTYVQEVKIERTWSLIDNTESTDMTISQYSDIPADIESQSAESYATPESTHSQQLCEDVAGSSTVSSSVQVEQSVQTSPPPVKPGCDVTKPEFVPQQYFYPTPCHPYPAMYPNPYMTAPPMVNPYYSYVQTQQQLSNQVFMRSVLNFTQKAQVPLAAGGPKAIGPPPGFEPNSNHFQPQRPTATDFYEAYNNLLQSRFS